jgi:hypothetical protein
MLIRFIKWACGPVAWLAAKRLAADAKAENERAELWRQRCVASEAREAVALERIAALEMELTNDAVPGP